MLTAWPKAWEYVIAVYTVFEQVWFSFSCAKYNFKINNKFRTLHNSLSEDYDDEAGNKKAKKCFTFFVYVEQLCLGFYSAYSAKAKLDTCHKSDPKEWSLIK